MLIAQAKYASLVLLVAVFSFNVILCALLFGVRKGLRVIFSSPVMWYTKVEMFF
jgi:hypothetical protein